MNSACGYVVAITELRHRSILRASLRAGITTDTNGGRSGTASEMLSSDRDRRMRTTAMTGARAQGSAASTAVAGVIYRERSDGEKLSSTSHENTQGAAR